jgi:tRNA threonylcarbamoyladenosine biosynthesis protein TsaE
VYNLPRQIAAKQLDLYLEHVLKEMGLNTKVESIHTRHPDEVQDAAAKILEICGSHRIFAIFGEMGAGKTTLVKALCAHLGSEDTVKSPTFSIVNEYDSPQGPVYHFDFYRIKHLEEVYDIGIEEYFDSGNYCFLEWPELIGPLIPEEAVELHIGIDGELERTIKIALQ